MCATLGKKIKNNAIEYTRFMKVQHVFFTPSLKKAMKQFCSGTVTDAG